MRKFFSIIVQLLLLPISFMQTALFIVPIYMLFDEEIMGSDMGTNAIILAPLMFVLCWGVALLVNKVLYKIKGQVLQETNHYSSAEGYKLKKTTTTHDVYYGGKKITSYDTNDYDLSYDNGYRTEDTAIMKVAKFAVPFAVVLRIVALVFAVLALFIPNIESYVRTPKYAKVNGYYVVLHCLFDVIILKRR